MEIKKSGDIANSTKTTSISIGDSRKGKTYFIGTACDLCRVFIIDAESGLKSIKDKKFDFVTVNTWKETEDALTWYLTEGYQNYDLLAIDSITRIQSYLKEQLKDGPDEHGKNKGNMTMGKYDILAIKLRKVVDVLTKKCPTSVHMTAMAGEFHDELTGATKIYPNLQGGFKFDLLGYFDTIMYHNMAVTKDGEQYWCEIAGSERNCAGTRLAELKATYGKAMPNNYKCIYDAVRA